MPTFAYGEDRRRVCSKVPGMFELVPTILAWGDGSFLPKPECDRADPVNVPRDARDISFATFSLYNLQLPGLSWRGSTPYTPAQ